MGLGIISDEDIKDTILHKLARHGYWKGRHTDFSELKKGFKPELLGRKGLKRVEDCGEQLIREGLIIPKRYPTVPGCTSVLILASAKK